MTSHYDRVSLGGAAAERVNALLSPSLEAMGYEVVRVMISGGRHAVLQIMAERKDGVSMSVDDCAEISHAASAILDVEDPIDAAYTLEVSSPGIDRPLTRDKDFDRFAGFEVRLETDRLVDGRKRFKGRLLGVAEEMVKLAEDGGVTALIPLPAISKAKLVITDDLLANSPDKPRM